MKKISEMLDWEIQDRLQWLIQKNSNIWTPINSKDYEEIEKLRDELEKRGKKKKKTRENKKCYN